MYVFFFFPKQTKPILTLQKGMHLKTDEIKTFQSIAEERSPLFSSHNQHKKTLYIWNFRNLHLSYKSRF